MDISKNFLKSNRKMFDGKINVNFKLPIELNTKRKSVFKQLKYDLELTKNNENNDLKKSFYENLLDPKSIAGKQIMEKWSNYYTSDIEYLKDSQVLYNNYFNIDFKSQNEILELWWSIKNDDNFYNKYSYIFWEKLRFLNESSIFLFVFGIYSILSPVLNILAPFIILIIPLLILLLG